MNPFLIIININSCSRKITVQTKKYGYYGFDFANILAKKGIVCEFCDPDFVVLMLTPEIDNLNEIENAMLSIPRQSPINEKIPAFVRLKQSISIRKAVLSPSESVPIEKALGRVVAITSVGCPPAVPIAVAGEIIDKNAIECFKYYGIMKCNVIK